MKWHRIAFDEEERAGLGEHTLCVIGEFTLHSITAVEIEDGMRWLRTGDWWCATSIEPGSS